MTASTRNNSRGKAPVITSRLLAKNSILNLAGQLLPLAVGILAVPVLISTLGTDRFGLLALIWIVIGYFGLFDFGLGRAITKIVADKLGSDGEDEIPSIVWTGLLLLAILGIASSASVIFLSQWLVERALDVPIELRPEATKALLLLGLTIPLVVVSVGLRGVLEAYQRFPLITAVRIPIGVWSFLGPVIAAQATNSLSDIVVLLALGRLVSATVFLKTCISIVSRPSRSLISLAATKSVLRIGSWMAISNIFGPLTAFMDRFLVAGLLSVTAVAYYSTPHQIVTRLLIVPAAILGVMFPVFASWSQNSPGKAFNLYKSSIKSILFILTPAVALIIVFAERAISLWIDPVFAANSYQVARLLAFGVLINCVGIVSHSYIQAAGRPDITAKITLIELPVYTAYLFILIEKYGINGAGLAWVIRVAISTIILAFFARHVFNKLGPEMQQPVSKIS